MVFYNRDDSTSVLDFDDISFLFKSGGLDSITLNDESDQIEKYWGAGAEVVFSSSTLLYDDTVQTTLESVNPGGVITPFDPFDPKQVLDNSCFEVGSNWILSTKFRLYDRNGSFASCSKKHNMFLRKIEATMIEESNQVMNINRMDHR